MELSKPFFPVAIDSTLIAAFRACPQKAFRQYIQHWKAAVDSVHLIAGGSFADGIEAARRSFYEENSSPEDAIALGLATLIKRYGDFECPPDSGKSLERTAGALEFYFENYPLGQDGAIPIKSAEGKHGIEFSFAQPLPINHPVSGDPILYTGRADMIAEAFGGVYIYDEKTTSQLGQSWSKQWELRSQFTGYCWAAQQFGLNPSGVVVRGVSILKTKYDTMQVVTYRSPFEIDRWLQQTVRDIARMIECWKEGYWDFDLDSACTQYGGCPLQSICKSSDPEAWLKTYFVKRVWNPLLRQEQTIEEYEADMKEWISDGTGTINTVA